MRHLMVFLLFILFTCSLKVQAIEVVLSEQQLNSLVSVNFPTSTRYGDYIYTLSQPNITVKQEDRSVAITLLLKATDSTNALLLANVTLSGQIAFIKKLSSLQLINPQITDFTIIENTDPSKMNIDGIKEVVGQHLPVSLLVDFKHLKQYTFNIMPTDIQVVRGGVLVQF